MKKTVKVLVFGMTPNPGGVESFLMNYYRKIDRNKIHFDFLCNTHNEIAYQDEIKSLGGKIFRIPMRSKHPLRYRILLKKFFKQNSKNYDAIWVNVNSLANIDYLKLAKKYGIQKRIIHSHNSQNMDSKLRGLLHNYNKKKITKYATDFWACSHSAARWFYNKKLMSKVKIIPNAIDLDRVKYNKTKRDQIRKKYNLKSSYVLGNIGRLHFQKNQSFALDIMHELIEFIPSAQLILVGDGPDRKKLGEKVERLNLKKNVLFVGKQKDIAAWLSAFDLFLFPSKFEGLPIAGLEAQGNGVPILTSENIFEKDAILNSNLEELSLNKDDSKKWAKMILTMKRNSARLSSKKIKYNFSHSNYEINNEIKKLESDLLS